MVLFSPAVNCGVDSSSRGVKAYSIQKRCFSTKLVNNDGKNCYIVFSGEDCFSVRVARVFWHVGFGGFLEKKKIWKVEKSGTFGIFVGVFWKLGLWHKYKYDIIGLKYFSAEKGCKNVRKLAGNWQKWDGFDQKLAEINAFWAVFCTQWRASTGEFWWWKAIHYVVNTAVFLLVIIRGCQAVGSRAVDGFV